MQLSEVHEKKKNESEWLKWNHMYASEQVQIKSKGFTTYRKQVAGFHSGQFG